VDWRPGGLVFTVDGVEARRIGQAPDYPVQLEIGVFDFPEKARLVPGGAPVPSLTVSHVLGRDLD
jgi:hypothetical protein